MLLLILRTIILYFLTLLALKAMGKREVGQLQPFELVVILIISEMASISMQSNGLPILNSIIPIIIITLLQITLALLNLKSEKFRIIFCGKPNILIKNGILQQDEMRRTRINLNDLAEELRNLGYFNIDDINYAVLETNGKISVLPKTDKRPVETADLSLNLAMENPAELIILDGHINQKAMQNSGKNQSWLDEKLKQNHIKSPQDVFVAGVYGADNFFFQLKEENNRHKKKAEGNQT